MTQSTTKPFADFSDYQGDPLLSEDPAIKQAALDQASEDAAIAKALQEAKEAMKSKQEAPAVKSVKAKLVKPKAAKKVTAKAGRIVGISKDENAYIQQVLQMIADDSELGSSNPNYVKIQARYNK
jgi:multidrug resistance efflux pump